jgi:hypothetical protein
MSQQRTRGVRRSGAPRLYEHRPDTATVVRISEDGRRAREEVVPVNPQFTSTPAHFEEDILTNAALEGMDWDYSLGDESLAVEPEDNENDGITVRVKAKRYKNSVRELLD